MTSSSPWPRIDRTGFDEIMARLGVSLDPDHLAEVYEIYGYITGMRERLADGLSLADEPAAAFHAEEQ